MIGIISFFSNILDLCANASHFIIFFPDISEFALEAILKDIWWEEEFREIKWLFLIIEIFSHLIIVVFLTHRQLVILLQKNLTLSLKLLKVVEERLINLLNTIDHNTNEDIVR